MIFRKFAHLHSEESCLALHVSNNQVEGSMMAREANARSFPVRPTKSQGPTESMLTTPGCCLLIGALQRKMSTSRSSALL